MQMRNSAQHFISNILVTQYCNQIRQAIMRGAVKQSKYIFFNVIQKLFQIKFHINLIEQQLSQMKEKNNGSMYKCSQVFGYKGSNEKIHQEDIITKLKFSQDGKNLALGDKAGRVIVFQSENSKKIDDKLNYLTEFQAYNRQFDPLHSSDIDEEIISFSWMRSQGNYHKMLTTNTKYVKLWKIYERQTKKMVKSATKDLALPKFEVKQRSTQAMLQHTFPNKHQQDIIQVQPTNNEEYMICTDTVKSIIWNFQKTITPFLVTDLKKNRPMEQVKQLINCMKVHPTSDSMFAFGTDKGSILFSDTRISNSYTPLAYRIQSAKDKNNFFNQMISSYSSLNFMNNKYIVARDYLSVKVWDISKFDKPMLSITIQQGIKGKLCEIFQNDCIYDKFNLAISKDSNTLLTGNYNNCFHTIDINNSANTQYEVNYRKQTIARNMQANVMDKIDKMDFSRKIIASDFNPLYNVLAVASLNCFLLYSL